MPPTSSPQPTRFVVKRLRWLPTYGGQKLSRLPGETAVASFATIDEAEIDRRKREEEARKIVNPFTCGDALHYLSHLDEPRLRDWLMDYGVDPPTSKKNGTTDWIAWWKKQHKKLSAEKQAAVWSALDKVQFFILAEEPLRPVGYAVVEVNWAYNDEYYDADPEGGRLLKVYRSKDKAEEECETRNVTARATWTEVEGYVLDLDEDDEDEDDEASGMFTMRERLWLRQGILDGSHLKRGLGSAANVPFFEVIEVELEGLE